MCLQAEAAHSAEVATAAEVARANADTELGVARSAAEDALRQLRDALDMLECESAARAALESGQVCWIGVAHHQMLPNSSLWTCLAVSQTCRYSCKALPGIPRQKFINFQHCSAPQLYGFEGSSGKRGITVKGHYRRSCWKPRGRLRWQRLSWQLCSEATYVSACQPTTVYMTGK